MWREDNFDGTILAPEILIIDSPWWFGSARFYVVEKSVASIAEYPEQHAIAPVLKVVSQVATFQAKKIMSKNQEYQIVDAWGRTKWMTAADEMWCLNIPHARELPCSHGEAGDALACNACFVIDPTISDKLEDNSPLEFVLLVHWQEHVIEFASVDTWVPVEINHLLQQQCQDDNWFESQIGNLVLAYLILRNEDGTAERIVLVAIPYESWAAASPKKMTVELV